MRTLPPPFCGPQERSLLNLENVTGNDDDSSPQQQYPVPVAGKEEVVVPNVLNLSYSAVLCSNEVQQGVISYNNSSRTPEIGSSGGKNSSHHIVYHANEIKNEGYEEVGEDLSECNDIDGGVSTDIESGREGLLVAILDR